MLKAVTLVFQKACWVSGNPFTSSLSRNPVSLEKQAFTKLFQFPCSFPLSFAKAAMNAMQWVHAQDIKLGKNREGGDAMVVFPSHLVVEPSCPGTDWTFGCPWEVVDKCLAWLCWCVWLLLYLLNRFTPSTQLFSLLPSWFSPLSHQGGVSKRLCGAQLLARIKQQHHGG